MGKIKGYQSSRSRKIWEPSKVKEQVNLAKEGIYLKVRKTLTEIRSKEADVESLEKQLEFATRVYETYEEQYKEGIKSISDRFNKAV